MESYYYRRPRRLPKQQQQQQQQQQQGPPDEFSLQLISPLVGKFHHVDADALRQTYNKITRDRKLTPRQFIQKIMTYPQSHQKLSLPMVLKQIANEFQFAKNFEDQLRQLERSVTGSRTPVMRPPSNKSRLQFDFFPTADFPPQQRRRRQQIGNKPPIHSSGFTIRELPKTGGSRLPK